MFPVKPYLGRVIMKDIVHPKKIWVDADSCPVRIRNIIIKGAERIGCYVYFVANRNIPLQASEHVKMIVTTHSDADSYIIKKIKVEELAVTRDIPLAQQLLDKGAIVINDRGLQFDSDNIKEKLSLRNFSYQLRENGYKINESSNYSTKEVNLFAAQFDKILIRFYASRVL